MLVGIAVVIGAVFLWEFLEGMGLVAWGLLEVIRQLLGRR
jgi:hypothetical protein